ncbi:hypothetical protein [Ferrimonas senticii]|uniref:hypothetical protein n=1 Tax=Ferrimonas senticii TaxID=394566 RepID=UPI00040A4A07|nr:hypothetical protein [Ferrimonas senticii]
MRSQTIEAATAITASRLHHKQQIQQVLSKYGFMPVSLAQLQDSYHRLPWQSFESDHQGVSEHYLHDRKAYWVEFNDSGVGFYYQGYLRLGTYRYLPVQKCIKRFDYEQLPSDATKLRIKIQRFLMRTADHYVYHHCRGCGCEIHRDVHGGHICDSCVIEICDIKSRK